MESNTTPETEIRIMSRWEEERFTPESGGSGGAPLDPEELRAELARVIPIYQEAFAGPPFYEVAQCPPECLKQGFCSTEIGEVCPTSGWRPAEEAYPAEELMADLWQRVEDGGRFIIEYANENGELVPQVVAEMRLMTAAEIADQKYAGQPAMAEWLLAKLGIEPVIWREELFADKARRPKGNLKNYARICREVADLEGCPILVGRTINPALLSKLDKDFGEAVEILQPAGGIVRNDVAIPERIWNRCRESVPDDRFVAIIDLRKEFE